MPSKGPSRTGIYVAAAVVVVAILAVAGLYAAGYLPSKSSTPTKPGACSSFTMLGAGSSFVQQLMAEWALKYSTNALNYNPVGSGTGISQITAKTIAFGATDAPLNATQQTAAPGLLTMPETAGAVAIIFNLPSGTFTHIGYSLNLTGAVLANIYLGTVSWWNDSSIKTLNPGVALPVAQIAVYHRSDGSGTSYATTQFLSASSSTWKTTIGYSTLPAWPKTPLGGGEKGSSGIAGTVKQTLDSIGYVDLGYAANNQISYAAIQNPAGKNVVPTANNTATAISDILATTTLPAGTASWAAVSMINAPGTKDYPIATFSYLLFYQK
ncbi:MAG: phosphate ABC transporter substrate-binding protein PstS, partial [Thermoplasmata archaeon]|nr:phosphate ABC transporter substrate-binding protein PstS [Thermoplasmata archaeon]